MREYSRKEVEEALKAHNAGREDPCFNEEYNKEHKLGTMAARSLVRQVAERKYGWGGGSRKVTMQDIINALPGFIEQRKIVD